MKRNRLVATTVASTITLALALAACGSDDSSSDEGSSDAAVESGDLRVWLVGTDTPQDARDYLIETFESENEGSTLTIEEQAWDGLVDKLTTSLSSSDSPDVVEVGNTQASAFTSAGFFADLTEDYDALGGDDLLQGFVEAGTYDDKFYAAPYYSGARAVFYTPQIVTNEIPTTLDEYISTAKDNTTDDVSGMWWPGQDWYNALPFVWENGGFIAEQADDGTWEAGFSSEGGIKGLEQVQDLMVNASNAPADGQETDLQVPFCEGSVGYLSAPTWIKWSIVAEPDAEVPGCSDTYGSDLAAFALPGADGGAAQVFAGGSNIAVAAKSENPELAKSALEIMLSDGYQKILAGNGLIPAKVSQAEYLPDDEITQAGAAAAANSKLTPASPKWADVEAQKVLQDSFVKIAQGGDVTEIATALDEQIESILNS
ncbi:extracellular solute-binding protein [Paraoerskovia marina]|uniref:Carbohydrate ABC transporter substrate-binding protein, CUT1 family n=1 Tax=Paraoerskovia marina TaxID=545619 RepID=A0A1H1UF61_9CELL|nr:extracellular solute-binding protein [Paraoerskovia marina]SDS71068.1 carbohydrate ABC transporter substrate-binding protein, CUT1 family [Paraoerskovia marina]